MVLRGDRIVVPAKLRQRMVEIAHEGHQGLVRTKQLLRAHVWFPGMDSQCDMFVSTYIACQSNTAQTHRERKILEISVQTPRNESRKFNVL